MVRTLAMLLLTMGVVFAQGPDPTRPFPNHEMPPEGFFCHPALNTKELTTSAHACDCRGMTFEGDTDPAPHCKKQPILDEEGNPTGEQYLPENNLKCKVACHPKHCHCSKRCETT